MATPLDFLAVADDRVPLPLLEALVDDAGLFPPAGLPMPEAVRRHSSDANDRSGVLSGRFVCPANRLDELASALDGPISLAVISPLDRESCEELLDRVAGDGRLVLAGLEGLPAGRLAEVESPVPVFVEAPVTGEWQPLLDEVAEAGLSAKVRCGGLEASLFPTARQLGGFISGCASRAVAFKATACLHHALCNTDAATGFRHHGFLNLLLAACRAGEGADEGDVTAALSAEGPETVVAELRGLSAEQAERARELFTSYGSCSTSEPIEDLVALGLLPAEVVAR